MEYITKDFFIETLNNTLSTTIGSALGAFRIEMREEFAKQEQRFNLKFDFLSGELGDLRREFKEFKTEMLEFKEETKENFAQVWKFRDETRDSFEEVNRKLEYLREKVSDDHEPRIIRLEHRYA